MITWLQSWLQAIRVARMMRLSCKLGIHLTLGGECWHQRMAKDVFPIWSAE